MRHVSRILVPLALGAIAVRAQECATTCGSWHFPPNQIDSIFELHPLNLPSTFTIEAWVKRAGPPISGHLIFSLATPLTDNCILLSAAALPDSSWHHLAVTSDGKTFLDGEDAATSAPSLQNRNGGVACSQPSSSFVVNTDQDAVASRLDPNQSADLVVNSLAIFEIAFSQGQAAERHGNGCFRPRGFAWNAVWGAWYGEDGGATDRSGRNLVPATLTLPAGGVEPQGPRCPLPPPSPPSAPPPPSPPSPPPRPPRPTDFCKSACASWRFPRAQTAYRFQLFPLELPRAFTIEGWLRHVGDPAAHAAGTYFFSLATPSNDNCVLLKAQQLPDDAWHHVAATSEGAIFLDGQPASTLGDNAGAECGGVPNSAFVLNVDQDRVAARLDPHQAANLVVNAIAIWDRALTPAQAHERFALGCLGGVDEAWGAWYPGDDDEEELDMLFGDLEEGDDRTGHGHDAFIALPWPGGLPAEGPACERDDDGDRGDDGDKGEAPEGGDVGGAYALGTFALLFALAALGLALYNGGFLLRFGIGPPVPRARTGCSSCSSTAAVTMGMPLAANDAAAASGSYAAASVPLPAGSRC